MTPWNKIPDDKIKEMLKDVGYELLGREKGKHWNDKVIVIDCFGYKYKAFLKPLLRGIKPDFVAKGNPFVLDNIALWLKINNKPFSLKSSNEYLGCHSHLSFICHICKNDFISDWSNIYANHGCGACAGRQVGEYNNLAVLSPSLLDEWDYDKNDIFPTNISVGSNKKYGGFVQNAAINGVQHHTEEKMEEDVLNVRSLWEKKLFQNGC